jgi:hypothetical protein
MPSDMTPPKVSGVAVSSNQVNIFFNETMSPGVGSLGTDTKSDYLLESPAGTPIDLTPSVVTVTFDYQHQNAVSITGLALTPGRTFHLAVHGVYDTTGNRIREDGVGNSFTGVVGRPAISLNDGNFGIRSNRFAFNYIGSPGQVVVIERTSDFLGWSPIATNTVGSQPVNFADPNPGNYPRRFYRLRLQ